MASNRTAGDPMPQPKSSTQDSAADQATQRIRELNERIIDASRKAGESYLDVYERSLKAMADFTEKSGETSNVEWLQNVANVQANFLRDMAKAYTDTARNLIK